MDLYNATDVILSDTVTRLAIGIVGSIIAAIIIWGIKKLYTLRRIKHSEYSGYWRSDIYENDEIVKTDFMYIKHNNKTNEFKGKIKRVFPDDQSFNERICKGVFTKDVMLTIAWSKINTLSYGVGYLVMTDHFTYSGDYLKHDKSDRSIFPVKLVKTKLVNTDDIEKADKAFR